MGNGDAKFVVAAGRERHVMPSRRRRHVVVPQVDVADKVVAAPVKCELQAFEGKPVEFTEVYKFHPVPVCRRAHTRATRVPVELGVYGDRFQTILLLTGLRYEIFWYGRDMADIAAITAATRAHDVETIRREHIVKLQYIAVPRSWSEQGEGHTRAALISRPFVSKLEADATDAAAIAPGAGAAYLLVFKADWYFPVVLPLSSHLEVMSPWIGFSGEILTYVRQFYWGVSIERPPGPGVLAPRTVVVSPVAPTGLQRRQ